MVINVEGLLFLAIALLLGLMGLLVLLKNRSLANKAFSTSALSLMIFCFLLALRSMDVMFPTPDYVINSVIIVAMYGLAPVGIMYCSFIILYGEYYLKNPQLAIMTAIYYVIYLIPVTINVLYDDLLTVGLEIALENLFVGLVIITTAVNFYKVSRLADELRRNLSILVVGLVIILVGTSSYGLLNLLQMEDFAFVGLTIIVIGFVLCNVAFLLRPVEKEV